MTNLRTSLAGGAALLALIAACGEDSAPGGDAAVAPLDGLTSDGGIPGAGGGGDASATGGNTGTTGANGSTGLTGTSGTGGSTGTSGNSGGLPSGEDYGGWTWVETPGAICRDGSPAGYYYREGSSDNLYIFLNGGGACADTFFCNLNPENVDEDLPHERLINATLNAAIGEPDPNRQVPHDMGMFKQDAANPLGDWSGVFVPYCTGDVHAGTRANVTIPGVEGTHNFMGYKNLGLFLESFGPHFSDSEQVVLTGSSAGSFGALLNADRVQVFFDQWDIDIKVIADSGIPMRDGVSDPALSDNPVDYMAPCLQSKWREYWGLNDAMPADCAACKGSAGGLTAALGDYLFKQKYAGRFLGGFISSVEDNVMRGFFGAGGNPADPASTCDNTDPAANVIAEATLIGNYPPQTYHRGLRDVVDNVAGRDTVAYYVMPGDKHMHLWRDRFYEDQGLGMTIAEWVAKVIGGEASHVGDLDQGL